MCNEFDGDIPMTITCPVCGRLATPWNPVFDEHEFCMCMWTGRKPQEEREDKEDVQPI